MRFDQTEHQCGSLEGDWLDWTGSCLYTQTCTVCTTKKQLHTLYMYVLYISCGAVQGDLFIKDTLGPGDLSTVERLSTFQR